MRIRIKRVYEKPDPSDGLRVLVDRLWPRGLSKQDAAIDIWAKALSPSDELRRWFNHDETRFKEFSRRYRNELRAKTKEIDELSAAAEKRETITLVFGAKQTTYNNAVVLQAWLQNHFNSSSKARERKRD